MTIQIWCAVAVIVLTIYALVKRIETRMVLFLAGLVMCLIAGSPVAPVKAFIKGMTNPTLVPAICSAMGFAAVVTASKCDLHLVKALATPLRSLGALLIPVCTIITFLINIAIMSAAGTAATVGATFIPLLIRAGIRPAGAAAAVAGGTMCGLLLNPGCAHDIYIAQMAKMELMDFIGWGAPYIVGLFLVSAVGLALVCIFKYHDHQMTPEEMATFEAAEATEFKVNPLKAIAPIIPMGILIVSAIWFPKAGVDVVMSMIIGVIFICLITLKTPGEFSKAFFKGLGSGYAQVIGLIIAAGVFVAGLQATGAVPAFIEFLKHSNDIARWGASIGPFLMAAGTGSGEAAIWAFNQAVTPSAASFGMTSEGLGLLAALAGQFGRTASPLAGAVIIVAGVARVSPIEVAKRTWAGMFAAVIVSALILV